MPIPVVIAPVAPLRVTMEIVAPSAGVAIANPTMIYNIMAARVREIALMPAVECDAMVTSTAPIVLFEALTAAVILQTGSPAMIAAVSLHPLRAAVTTVVRLEVGEATLAATAMFDAMRLAVAAMTAHPERAVCVTGTTMLALGLVTTTAPLGIGMAAAALHLSMAAAMAAAILVGLGGCRHGNRQRRDAGC